jgi:hypothetical protein
MKPVFATLRQYGYKNAGYIDDSLLIGDAEEECESNIKDTDTLLKCFVVLSASNLPADNFKASILFISKFL